MANNRDLNIRLNADSSGFEKGFKSAESSAKAFEKELARVENAQRAMAGQEAAAYAQQARMDKQRTESLGRIGVGVAAAGATLAAGLTVAVKTFADFDAQMSSVQAATHETAGNMGELRQAAIKAGSDTAYSATEAAGAIEELAKAGVSTKDILGGGLTGALNLAAAGGLDVADAAEAAASAMTQFKLSGAQVPHIADLLAAGAGKAQGDVSDMNYALSQSGLVAAQMGLTIEQTTGTLAAFASAGLMGSDAGTSLRTMLLALANPSTKAAETMAELGINAYDAQGNFVGVAQLAGTLKDRLSGLTQEQRNSALATIFGSDAIRAASILYTDGAEGINEWVGAVNDQGYAAETAATKMDNLKGQVEQLKGSLETLLITLGGNNIGDWAESGAKGLNSLVDDINELPGPIKSAVGVVGTLAAGVTVAGGAALYAIPKYVEMREAITASGIASSRAAALVARWGTVAIGTAAAVGAVYAGMHIADSILKVEGSADQTTQALRSMATGATVARSSFDVFDTRVMGHTYDDVKDASDAVEQFGLNAGNAAGGGLRQFWNTVSGLGQSGRTYTRQVEQLDAALANMVQTGNAKEAAAAFEKLSAAAQANGVDADELKAKFGQYAAALDSSAAAASSAQTDVTGYSSALADASGTSDELVKAQDDLRAAIDKASGSFVDVLGTYQDALSQKEDAERESAEATAAATESGKDSWKDYAKDVSLSLDEYLAKLQEQVTAQQNWQRNLLELSGRLPGAIVEQLAQMGPDAAELIQQMTTATGAQLDKLVALLGKAGGDGGQAFSDQLETAIPMLSRVGALMGQGWVDQYISKLQDGSLDTKQVAQDMAGYLDRLIPKGTTTTIHINGQDVAVSQLREIKKWLDAQTDKTVTLTTVMTATGYTNPSGTSFGSTSKGQVGYGVLKATGGPISGPGGPTSDSIPAWLSDGEYVIRASQAARHRDLLDSINSGGYVPKFATGGPVDQLTVRLPATGALTSTYKGVLGPVAQEMQKAISLLDVAGPGASGGVAGAGVQRWSDVTLRALSIMGQPAALLQTVLRRMQQESGGNPDIVNRWDSNWKAGHPSVGLMQVIRGTYAANVPRGYDVGPYSYGVSTNPLANELASMHYAIGRYGSLAAAYNRAGGYALGGPVVGPGGPTDDAVPALLSNGEFVVNARAAARNRALLTALNAPGYATGGLVSAGSRGTADVTGGTVAGNSFDLRGYLAGNINPAAVTVDDTAVRAATLALAGYNSALAATTAAMTAAQTASDAAADELTAAQRAYDDAVDTVAGNVRRISDAYGDWQDAVSDYQDTLKDAGATQDQRWAAEQKAARAQSDYNDRLIDQANASESAGNALNRLNAAKDAATSTTTNLTRATTAQAQAQTAAADATDAQTAAQEALADAQAKALAYAQQVQKTALAGANVVSLFSADDPVRAAAFARAAYDASLAAAKATTDATEYQSQLDAVAAAGAKVAATQQALGASYSTVRATLTATRTEVDKLARSYGFTAAESAKLADSAVDVGASADQIATSLEAQLAQLNTFATAVRQLRAAGLSNDLVGQIVDAGPATGLAVAQSILDAGSQMIGRLNAAQAGLTAAASTLGTNEAAAIYAAAAVTPATVTTAALIARGTRATKKATGGLVAGPGGPTDDTVPAWLSAGEYVIRAASVARYGTAFLDHLNAGRYASGGLVAARGSGARAADAPIIVHVEAPAVAGQNSGPAIGSVFSGPVTIADTTDLEAAISRARFYSGALGTAVGR